MAGAFALLNKRALPADQMLSTDTSHETHAAIHPAHMEHAQRGQLHACKEVEVHAECPSPGLKRDLYPASIAQPGSPKNINSYQFVQHDILHCTILQSENTLYSITKTSLYCSKLL